MKNIIVNKLEMIQRDHNVKVLWAIESGSRSWGFESPDSDYDVRFIYVNQPNWYLSIQEQRDVIELPIDEVLDISGWDLRKTLRLFKKSNPVLMEWLVSPCSYLHSGSFKDKLIDIASDCFSRKACSYHYLRMAENNYQRYVKPRNPVNLKKYFYVLRPLLNIFWIRQHDSIPPMNFLETVNSLDIANNVQDAIERLLEKKKVTSEVGKGPHIPELDHFIEEKMLTAQEFCDVADVGHINTESLDILFRDIIAESWNQSSADSCSRSS